MKSELDRADLFDSAEYPSGPVLHLVGRVTESVFSFLGPATATLARHGVRQTVVLIDDPLYRHLLPKFHESVRLVLTSADGGPVDRLKQLLDAFCAAARARKPVAAHLHGVTPLLLGMYAARVCGVAVPTYFSPHGSRLLGPFRTLGSLILRSMRPFARRSSQRAIVSNRVDGRTLNAITHQAIDVIESSVGVAFFDSVAAPGDSPLIVTASRQPNPLGAALFAQCAVLFADQAPGLRFSWIGTADRESVARLKAAGVWLLDVNQDEARAERLAESWLYVAPAGGLGFPVYLAEAMAIGLPCVAWDTPYHRDVIRDGETGYLCADTEQVLTRVAELVESEALRRRIGDNARREARQRFDGGGFRNSLLSIYGATARR